MFIKGSESRGLNAQAGGDGWEEIELREEKFRFAKTGVKDHSRFLNRKDGKNARS